MWPKVESFINSLDKFSIVGDFGCGNGKNMSLRNDLTFVGSDISIELLKIAKNRLAINDYILANVTNLPFSDNSLDACISIAVIHHLSKIEDRLQAIREMLRVLRKNGRGLIFVWAFEQSRDF